MYGVLLVLAIIVLANCGDLFSESTKEWWATSRLRKWGNPIVVVALIAGVSVGIHYDVFHWALILIPIAMGLPFLFGTIVGIWRNMMYAGEDIVSKDGAAADDTPDARKIALRCLKAIGCQPEAKEENIIEVSYQGENFVMECAPKYVRIWDPNWAGFSVNDPNLLKLHEAINMTNYKFGTTTLLAEPDNNGIMGLHTIRDIMLDSGCKDNHEYLKAALFSIFEAKEELRKNFNQILAAPAKTQQNRRPVGFATEETVPEGC